MIPKVSGTPRIQLLLPVTQPARSCPHGLGFRAADSSDWEVLERHCGVREI